MLSRLGKSLGVNLVAPEHFHPLAVRRDGRQNHAWYTGWACAPTRRGQMQFRALASEPRRKWHKYDTLGAAEAAVIGQLKTMRLIGRQ